MSCAYHIQMWSSGQTRRRIIPHELMEEKKMTWTAPKIEEICLGMEINMYYPADEREDDGLF